MYLYDIQTTSDYKSGQINNYSLFVTISNFYNGLFSGLLVFLLGTPDLLYAIISIDDAASGYNRVDFLLRSFFSTRERADFHFVQGCTMTTQCSEPIDSSTSLNKHNADCTNHEPESHSSPDCKEENGDTGGMFINFSSDMSDGGFKGRRKYKRAYKVNGVNILNRYHTKASNVLAMSQNLIIQS